MDEPLKYQLLNIAVHLKPKTEKTNEYVFDLQFFSNRMSANDRYQIATATLARLTQYVMVIGEDAGHSPDEISEYIGLNLEQVENDLEGDKNVDRK